MIRPAILLFAASLAACTQAIQTTSGSDYIAARHADGTSRPTDAEIRKIAAVEPSLRFPARIGVARVVNGQLTLPPAPEADLFANASDRLARYGSFVQVSPLIASMVDGGAPGHGARPGDVVSHIRRAAARQHLDYVLIYEIGARSRSQDTPFALADVTLIGGMMLPTRNIKVQGVGQALFVDVRNGYPYGTAQVAEDLSGLGRSWVADRRAEALRERAVLKVAGALLPEVEAMLADLAPRARN